MFSWYLSVPLILNLLIRFATFLITSRDTRSHGIRKPVYAICKQQRRRSACASAQSDQRPCFRCLDSIIPLVSISEISSLYLASMSAQADLSLPWSQTPNTDFLVTRLKVYICGFRYWAVCSKVTWVYYELRHDKTNKMAVCPAKTQISLGIRRVWTEFSLSAWRKLWSLATHWARSEDSDQTGRMPRLIWVFAGHTHFVGFVMSWLIYSSYVERLRKDKEEWKGCDRQELHLHSKNHLSNEEQTVLFYNQN